MTDFFQNLKCVLEAFCEIGVLLSIFIGFVIFAATFEYIKTLYTYKVKPYIKFKVANFKERISNNRKAKLSLAVNDGIIKVIREDKKTQENKKWNEISNIYMKEE